jgi:hypothetical protein
MNEKAQKQYLESRNRFRVAKEAWYAIGRQTSEIAAALTKPDPDQRIGGGWHLTTGPEINPARWPSGAQIAEAWQECSEAYRDVENAFKALSWEDREYLEAQAPER